MLRIYLWSSALKIVLFQTGSFPGVGDTQCKTFYSSKTYLSPQQPDG